jgi:glycosyltransferase involved in cell wall biosynthesis
MAPEPHRSLSVGIFYRDLLGPGGMPRETALLAREMQRFVDRLVLYTYVGDASQEGSSRIEGVPVRAFYQPGWRRSRDPFRAPGGVGDFVRKNVDDIAVLVLIGSFIPENVPVARAAQEGGIPYVLSVGAAFSPHLFSGLKGLKKRLYEQAFERGLVNGALAIRLYSEAQAPHLTSRGYVDDGRFFIAKEGIDWDTIERENGMVSAASSDGPQDPLMFGFLGRLSTYGKGLDILLDAWSLYKHDGGQGRLTIAGPASRWESLRLDRLRRRLDIPAVDFLPGIFGEAKYRFLRSLSFLVHPSRHEGIPRVVREALAIGRPVIVTDNTNLHDLVEHHGAGAVVRTNSRDLARTLMALENSQEEWPAFQEGARRAALSLNWEDVARDLIHAIALRLAAHPRADR